MLVINNRTFREWIRRLIPFVVIPLLVLMGATVFDEQRYLLVSLGVAVLALLLFIAGFESKTTGTRRMVIVAVMTALCIVGRFIPLFKPVTAITVLAAVYLGGEAGFLVGALSALLSNIYFGQGPWTPFQMLGWGLIGLVAGAFAKPLQKSRLCLLLFGALAGLVYSLIMDVWTVLWYSGTFVPSLYVTAIVTALPHTAMYMVSNFVFLWWMGKPFGEKLGRIKIKYGV